MEKLQQNCKNGFVILPFINMYKILILFFIQSAISPFLQEMFMPLVRTIFTVLSSPVDDGDQVTATEKKMLQRAYYLFISTIVSNDGLDVLKNQGKVLFIFDHIFFLPDKS